MTTQIIGQSAKKHSSSTDHPADVIGRKDGLETAVNLLINVTEVVCEYEADLDLMRLVNFMDLYRAYLASLNTGEDGYDLRNIVSLPSAASQNAPFCSNPPVSFEQFIGDSSLLKLAAALVEAESGERVASPTPLLPNTKKTPVSV